MNQNLPDPTDQSINDDKKQAKIVGRGGNKERGSGSQEVTPITEFTRKVDIEPEVEGWLEKIEKEDSQLNQQVSDDQTGQVVLDDVNPDTDEKKFKVILPLTKDEVDKGVSMKVIDSARWLAEWCIRMIKIFGNKVAYKKK